MAIIMRKALLGIKMRRYCLNNISTSSIRRIAIRGKGYGNVIMILILYFKYDLDKGVKAVCFTFFEIITGKENQFVDTCVWMR